MPIDLTSIFNDLRDPGTALGAVVYAAAFAAGAWLGGQLVRLAVSRALDGHVPGADPTAVRFLGHLARLAIYVVALFSYIHQIPILRQLEGVWLTSVGVVSIVVGIAAQSTLGNLISGVALLLYRPFRLGDRLQITSPTGLESGVVESLSLGYTTLKTDDNRTIVIPNSVMASQTSINIPQTVAVITLNLAHTADIDRARTILLEIAASRPKDFAIAGCRISALSDTATTLTLTLLCADTTKTADAKSDILEAVKKRFDAQGIPLSH